MKKLIIVCEEKCRVYGDYLSQLISMDDDTDDNIIGVKDGEVAAQVWVEKDYKANSNQISSNQHILFIGHSKLIKEKSMNMNVVFSDYGMKYGWLGKQAVLWVERTLKESEYEGFINYATSYQSNLKKLIDKNADKKEKLKEAGKVALVGLAVGNMIVGAPLAVAVMKLKLNKKIEEQQYSCEITKFYMEDLSKFLGM